MWEIYIKYGMSRQETAGFFMQNKGMGAENMGGTGRRRNLLPVESDIYGASADGDKRKDCLRRAGRNGGGLMFPSYAFF